MVLLLHLAKLILQGGMTDNKKMFKAFLRSAFYRFDFKHKRNKITIDSTKIVYGCGNFMSHISVVLHLASHSERQISFRSLFAGEKKERRLRLANDNESRLYSFIGWKCSGGFRSASQKLLSSSSFIARHSCLHGNVFEQQTISRRWLEGVSPLEDISLALWINFCFEFPPLHRVRQKHKGEVLSNCE